MKKIKRPRGNKLLCYLDKVGLPPYQWSLRRHFKWSEFQVKTYQLIGLIHFKVLVVLSNSDLKQVDTNCYKSKRN
jgi:hypothetical protein